MSPTKRTFMWLLSANLTIAGFVHLLNPGFFIPLIPPGLPSPEWLNLLSGLAEIVLGVYLLEPRTRIFAAWGIVALLIAVFPANVYGALENVGPEGPGTGPGAFHWIRLPFQALFLAWAFWFTREDPVHA